MILRANLFNIQNPAEGKKSFFLVYYSMDEVNFRILRGIDLNPSSRKDAEGGLLWKHTRHKLKHRKRPVTGKQTSIKNKVSIEQRPAVVDAKERFGAKLSKSCIYKKNVLPLQLLMTSGV